MDQRSGRRPEPDPELDLLAHRVVDAAVEVHRHLGPGYLESVHGAALAVELRLRGIPFKVEHTFEIRYKGEVMGEGRVDFLVGDRLVVELKSVDRLAPVHKAQVISYLKALGAQLALLINFNERLLKEGIQRIVLS